MAVSVVIARENAEKLEDYEPLGAATFKGRSVTVRAIHGRHEVFDGPAVEDIVVLELPTSAAAQAWYHGATHRAASEHRVRGGDYRCILTEGSRLRD